MGTWGFNILENDSSADAYSEYIDAMNSGLTHAKALARVKSELADMMEDSEDAAYAWLGIAKAMWEYGTIDDKTIKRVQRIGTSNSHLSEWEDAGPKARQKRAKVISRFVEKLRSKNPKPKKPRKARLHTPVYEPGTCLAIKLPTGKYLAGLVLFHVIEDSGPGQDTLGINTVGILDYLEDRPPAVDVFEKRDFAREQSDERVKPWLPIARQCFSNFHRKSKNAITVVGSVKLTRADAILGRMAVGWEFRDAERLIKVWRKTRKQKGLLIADRMEDVPQWRKVMDEVNAIHRKYNPKHRSSWPTPEEQIDLSPLEKR